MKDQPLLPRNGHTLVVGIVARISGGPNQKELSLQDQEDHGKQVVADLYDGHVDYRVIATTGKGERLDRPELDQVEKMLRSRELDLLVVEDLGRLVRGTEACWLCGIAVDHGTRVIAPNDCIDTIDDSWEEDVISACRDHVGHNAHTSKRLKHKLMNRFVRFGGAMAREIYGYAVSDEAETYSEWIKDEAATPIYSEWFKRLLQAPNCSLLADWLNEKGVPTGPYSRNEKWDGRMVRRVTRNPLLKGMPGRGFRHTVKHNETGRRVSVKNPRGPQFQHYPHLAHVEPAVWDEVNALLEKSNEGLGRKAVSGADPRAGVPRKRTIWPGQHVRCGICNRLYYWGGHGQNEHMMCSGARDYLCWNGVTFDGIDAGRRLTRAILSEIESLPAFDQTLLDKVKAQVELRRKTQGTELAKVDRDLEEVLTQLGNVANAIARLGLNDILEQKLASLKVQRDTLARKKAGLNREPAQSIRMPTMEEIRGAAKEIIERLPVESQEFGQLMRQLVVSLNVYPHRLRDGGSLVLRAKITLNLAPLTEVGDAETDLQKALQREMVVDLFDPPQRVQIREQLLALRAEGMTERHAAGKLKVTVTAAQRSAALNRILEEGSFSDPYVPVLSPPTDCSKLRRHLHARYNFTPQE